MEDLNEYQTTLSQAIDARREWLDKTELPKLKEELRGFQMAYGSLYQMYLKKGLINEDPYKAEAKILEIQIPATANFPENERLEKMSIRLAEYDNQLDFLVNFYQFSADYLSLERIKKILGLIKYIDWVHLVIDSSQQNTRSVAEITNSLKTGLDAMTLSVCNESLSRLTKNSGGILAKLKTLTDFNREAYKLDLRVSVLTGMSAGDAAQVAAIKKKFSQTQPDKPFYPDLAEEIIKENTAKNAPELWEAVLKSLKVAASKPKVIKKEVPLKTILIEGIQSIGACSNTLGEIIPKMDENKELLESRKRGFFEKLKLIFQQMMNKEPDPIIYDISYLDPVKDVQVREKLDYTNFRGELDRKVRVLSNMNSRGPALAKLESMQEEQLVAMLERTIRDVQNIHKILNAHFFKPFILREIRCCWYLNLEYLRFSLIRVFINKPLL
ncbi:hypothetical protein FACS1894200_10760 [Spirochaetia bacterium]|nr:hypothetical protein FACS1894200_10760 [Spirochaetia bacterium]